MYAQKVVWIGTVLGETSVEEFEEFFSSDLGFDVKYIREFKMNGGEYDGLNCILFGISSKDIAKFAIYRINTVDMKWFEDFIDNHGMNIPEEICMLEGEV